jgi:hypothetical protein
LPLGPHRRNGSHRIGATVGGAPLWGALLMLGGRWGEFGLMGGPDGIRPFWYRDKAGAERGSRRSALAGTTPET